MKNCKLLFLCIVFFIPALSFSQSEIDSLVNFIKTDKEDTTKVIHSYKLCSSYFDIGDYKKALQYGISALQLAQQLNYKKGIAASYNNIGLVFWMQGNYASALDNYFKSLKIFEEIYDKKGMAFSYGNIGLIYFEQGNYTLALDNILKSLEIKKEIGNKEGISNSYNSIGNIYWKQLNYPLALENFSWSLKIYEEIGNKSGIATSKANIGGIYSDQGNYIQALSNHIESLKIFKEINDKQGIALSYNNISIDYKELNQCIKAIEYSGKALVLSKEIGNKEQIKTTYQTLSSIYYQIGEYKKAYENYQLYSQYKDSLINEESLKQLGDLKTNYAVEKKEIEMNAEQEKEKAVFKTIIWAVLGGLLLVVIFAGFITRALQTTKRQKVVIEKQKLLVDEKNLHIEEKQKEIISSITYAKRLQEAILPPLELIKKNIPESFVLYLPKDIVAGDFYWMETIDNTVFIAAADSTGHGVPGAMVSVVCSNALNRAVKEFGLRDTGKILDKVTDLVLETFEKSNSEVKDGMDISLLAYNKETNQLQWSGANNPLWYIHNGIFSEVKPDKQPVGKHDNRKPFTTHTIPSVEGSIFYLFTDGLPDQFGGEKGKKYLYKRFKETLLALSELPLSEQEPALQKEFLQWKGELEQVDDVTVIGIKI